MDQHQTHPLTTLIEYAKGARSPGGEGALREVAPHALTALTKEEGGRIVKAVRDGDGWELTLSGIERAPDLGEHYIILPASFLADWPED